LIGLGSLDFDWIRLLIGLDFWSG